jgi:peptidyl-prolyl isomerase E (cyclophilin E)
MVDEAKQRTVYIGGLDEAVTVAVLRAAFLPFGEVKAVDVPIENVSGKHRGFGFVEFEEAEDAKEAVFNMDNSELFGRTVRCNLARASVGRGRAVWSAQDEALEWYNGLDNGAGGGAEE